MADKHIKLIVTGMSEKISLHESLKKYFPTHTANGDLVVWDAPRRADGITGHRLSAEILPSASVTALVNVMFAEIIAGKHPNSHPADLVIVIDDVELGNLGQEDIVVQTFLTAVDKKLILLQELHSAVQFQKIKARVQSCCSFHLLRPMVEAYFFADTATLISEGVNAKNLPVLAHSTDVEKFDASPDLHSDWVAKCQEKNTAQQVMQPWWQTERHPKHYLTHLLSISAAPAYHETTLGARLINAVNWSTVAKVATDVPIASALLEDIWDWFGQTPSAGSFQGLPSSATYKVKITLPNKRLLRNT